MVVWLDINSLWKNYKNSGTDGRNQLDLGYDLINFIYVENYSHAIHGGTDHFLAIPQ